MLLGREGNLLVRVLIGYSWTPLDSSRANKRFLKVNGINELSFSFPTELCSPKAVKDTDGARAAKLALILVFFFFETKMMKKTGLITRI